MKHTSILLVVLLVAVAVSAWFIFTQTQQPTIKLPEVASTDRATNTRVPEAANTPAKRVTLGSYGISIYEKQGNDIYCNQEKMLGVDSATFVYLETTLAKDKNHVYVCTPGSESPDDPQYHIIDGADPKTFVDLGSTYAKDARQVFLYNRNGTYSGAGTSIDVATFSVFPSDLGYAKDKNHVYVLGTIMEGVDPSTFVPKEPSQDLYYREYGGLGY